MKRKLNNNSRQVFILSDNEILSNNNNYKNANYFHRQLILEALLSVKSLVSGDLLDVGCGTQPYRSLFTNIKSYTGVDIPNSYHPLPSDVVLFDGTSIPFPSNSFDWVMATEVLEHVQRPELLLSSILEVLHPGGTFFLTVPFLQYIHEAPHDFRRWTNYGLIDDLQKVGFERIEVQPLGDWHTALAAFLRLYVRNCKIPWWAKYWLPMLVWSITNIVSEISWKVNQNMCVGWFAIAYKPEEFP